MTHPSLEKSITDCRLTTVLINYRLTITVTRLWIRIFQWKMVHKPWLLMNMTSTLMKVSFTLLKAIKINFINSKTDICFTAAEPSAQHLTIAQLFAQSQLPSMVVSSGSSSTSSPLVLQQQQANGSSSGGQTPLYVCNVCQYVCPGKFHLNSHMNTHSDRRCSFCDYTSRTEGRLKKHMAEAHRPVSPTQPDGCAAGGVQVNNYFVFEKNGSSVSDWNFSIKIGLGECWRCIGTVQPNPIGGSSIAGFGCGRTGRRHHGVVWRRFARSQRFIVGRYNLKITLVVPNYMLFSRYNFCSERILHVWFHIFRPRIFLMHIIVVGLCKRYSPLYERVVNTVIRIIINNRHEQ